MNFDLRGKIVSASLVTVLVIAPVGVWGFKNWRAQAATPPVNTLVQPQEQVQAAALVTEPAAAAVTDTAKTISTVPNDKKLLWQDYQVVEGDTLSGVASKFGLATASIAASNGLDEEATLSIDQKLVIPSSDGVVHQTSDGDSLWYLASLYQVTLESIIEANPEVNPDTLAPETKLFIPGAQPIRPREAAANRGGGEEEATAVESAPTASTGNSGSTFGIWPTSGPITSYYGWRDDPVYGGSQFHKGIDIGAPTGQSVVAVGSGRVVMASGYGGYGLTVLVDHQNGLVTRYAHLSRIDVSEGQRVSAGQRVGAVGSTGKSTGPHLDFGVNVGGKTADPLDYLP